MNGAESKAPASTSRPLVCDEPSERSRLSPIINAIVTLGERQWQEKLDLTAERRYVTLWSHMEGVAHDDDLIWKALSDPQRREILDILRDGPRRTREICARFRVSRFAVMKHLKVLEAARLIIVRRSGRDRWNHLNPTPLQQIYERWMTPYMALWSHHLMDLKQTVEHREGKRKERKHGDREQAAATRS